MVVGFDRYINYYKIQYATLCIRENPGCLFIATNRDAVTHLTDAQVGTSFVGSGVRVQGQAYRSRLETKSHRYITDTQSQTSQTLTWAPI